MNSSNDNTKGLTPDDVAMLERLEGLAKAATPGRWEETGKLENFFINNHSHEVWPIANADTGIAVIILPLEDASDQARKQATADAAFITAAGPDVILRLISLARSAQEEKWVSVEERLPELLLEVQAETSEGDIFKASVELEEDQPFWWGSNSKQEIYHVIRWRPLPPSPSDSAAKGGE